MFKGKGFTLVELLVVLIIIGILVAIAIPAGFRAINQANIRECAANIRSLDTAIQMYYTENDRDWPTTMAQITPLLANQEEPHCHVAGNEANTDYVVVDGTATVGGHIDRTNHAH